MGSLDMTLCAELHPVTAPPGTAHAVTGLVLAGAATTAVLLLPRALGATRTRDDGETGTKTENRVESEAKPETRAESGTETKTKPGARAESGTEPEPQSETEV
ncbi:hypothetical protein [Streptomyces sp. NPDC003393]